MMLATQRAIAWTEQGLVPDTVVRQGIRRLLKQRLSEIHVDDVSSAADASSRFASAMAGSAIALQPQQANEQHYELPAAFFAQVLGPHRKYSACWWPQGVYELEEAETAALAATCERAQIEDGQHILELGCGWGSLTLWIAELHPTSRITAVSNSRSQREYIEAEVKRRRLLNVQVITADMNAFDTDERYDRVVSIEMFEHMRNWPELFKRVSRWLKPGGRFFMHVFVHRSTPYAFIARDESDWMSRFFFSGGMMPSDDLPLWSQDHLRILRRWRWDGTHYERTCDAWLENMDVRRDAIMPILQDTYGQEHAYQWWTRWRIFFMSCAELFGYERGQQWWVSHYLFEPRP